MSGTNYNADTTIAPTIVESPAEIRLAVTLTITTGTLTVRSLTVATQPQKLKFTVHRCRKLRPETSRFWILPQMLPEAQTCFCRLRKHLATVINRIQTGAASSTVRTPELLALQFQPAYPIKKVYSEYEFNTPYPDSNTLLTELKVVEVKNLVMEKNKNMTL
jgi:hypothetical protein